MCTTKCLPDGQWVARAKKATIGEVGVTGKDRDEALSKLRAEIRYRLEYCPCGGVGDEYVELVVPSPAPETRSLPDR